MSVYLLALDIGTSACKGALFDLDGRAVQTADCPYSTGYPRPGWAEQEPEDWWAAVCKVTRTLIDAAGVAPSDIAAVGVDGQSWAMVALDRDGSVLLPSPLWTDNRAAEACGRIRKEIGEEALHRVCGNPLMPGYTTPKVLWYRENHPELYSRTRAILQSNGFIVQRLTGVCSQDVSQGYGWYCFRSDTERWDPDMARALGIEPALLPELCACHDIVGTVTEAAAKQTGLIAGIPVAAGGLDAAASTLGVGVTENGETQEQGGQAGGMSICLDHYASHPRLILSPHVVPRRWLLQGGTTGGGGALKWLREQCCPELSFAEMSALAAQAPPMSGGLLFLPYMSGERSPLWMPEAQGVFYGLHFGIERSHMIRAVMEGVAFALRHNLETALEAGCAVGTLRATGGSASSAVWMDIKANVTGCEMVAAQGELAAVRGAALIAGVGVGAVSGWNAWKTENGQEKRYLPADGLREVYEAGFERYLALSGAMQPLYKRGI